MTPAGKTSRLLARTRSLIANDGARGVFRTAATNFFMMAVTLASGVLISRTLGDAGRGNYAAIMSWLGVALVFGEFGQSAAVTFRVSRTPADRARITGSASTLTLPLNVILAVAGFACAGWLAGGDAQIASAYRIACLALLVNGALGPQLYALQAVSLPRWNLARATLPTSNLAIILLLWVFGALTVQTICIAVVLSSTIQLLLATWYLRSSTRRFTHRSRQEVSFLAKYGAKYWASAVPQTATSNLDRISLSQWSTPAVLGQYSVALSAMSLTAPLASAISSALFPKLAALHSTPQNRRWIESRIMLATLAATGFSAVFLLVVSPWLIPLLYGPEFSNAAQYTAWLLPAAILQSLTLVAGTILRGQGQPGRAGFAQILSLVLTAFLVFVLVPEYGARGAAIAAAGGPAVSLMISLFLMRGSTRT